MATTTSTTKRDLDDADDIRRYMAQIRRELHEDIQGVVLGAEAATDWRRYVKMYPWPFVGAAAVIGFFLVPPRRRSITHAVERAADAAVDRVETAKPRSAKNDDTPSETKEKEKTKRSLVRTAFALAAPIVWRAVQGYATQFAENWVAEQMARQMATGPQPGGPPPGGRPQAGRPVPPSAGASPNRPGPPRPGGPSPSAPR